MNKNMKWIIAAVLVVVLAVAAVVVFGGSKQDQQTTDPVVPTVVVEADPTEAPTAEPQQTAEATTEPAADTASAEATAEPDAEATPDPKAVMVTVNGTEVLREEVDLICSNLAASYAQYGYDTSDPTFMTAMQGYAVQYAVQLKLMEQKAVELGFDKFTDEEKATIEAENAANWNEIVDMYMSYYGGTTEESTEEEKAAARVNVLTMLEGMGYTEAVMLEDAMANAKLDRVEASMVEGAAVTDEEVKALFDEYVKQDEASYKEDAAMYEYMTQYYGQTAYYVPAGYRGITHILLEVDETLLGDYQALAAELEEQQEAAEATEAPAETAEATEVLAETAEATEVPAEATEEPKEPVTQADVDAAYQAIIASVQPTIDEINKKLGEGVAFADLIAEYGTDPGMEQEPNKSQGYSVHMDSVIWDPAFVKAAFSVDNVGDIAEPVVGSYGVHIVQYTRDVPAGAVEYTADIQLALHEEALSKKESELFSSTMETWMNEAQVTFSAEAQSMIDAMTAE